MYLRIDLSSPAHDQTFAEALTFIGSTRLIKDEPWRMLRLCTADLRGGWTMGGCEDVEVFLRNGSCRFGGCGRELRSWR